MAIRSTLWLMLFVMFGVRCETKINFRIRNEKFYGSYYLEFTINYKKLIDEVPQPKGLTYGKSSFYCIDKDEDRALSFRVSDDRRRMNLNTATDYGVYTKHDHTDQSQDFQITTSQDTDYLCFLTGTWWPSEKEKNVELYINFLSDRSYTVGVELIYLRSIVSEKQIGTRLMLKKDQLYEKPKEESKEELNREQEKELKRQLKNLEFQYEEAFRRAFYETEYRRPFEKSLEEMKVEFEQRFRQNEKMRKQQLDYEEATKPIFSKNKATNTIITECAKSDHRVIGNINYPITKNPKVEFKFGHRSMTYAELGEFNMAFISKKNITTDEARAAVKLFTEIDSKNVIDTTWAKVTSTDEVVELTLVENLRLLSEGTGKFGFSLSNSYLAI